MTKNKMKRSIALFLVATMLSVPVSTVFAAKPLPTRSAAGDKYKWKLEDIYASRQAFEKDVKLLKEKYIPALAKYEGKLNTAANIAAYMKLDEEASVIMEKVYMYPKLLADLDQSNNAATEMVGMAMGVYGDYGAKTAFATPEILSLSEKQLKDIIADKSMKLYVPYLEGLLEQKAHILSKEGEGILAMAGELGGTPRSVFDKATLADFQKAKIKGKDGKEIELTNSVYSKILEEGDRETRQAASQARGEAYGKINNTLAATYLGEVKKNIFFAKARGYNSALEAALTSTDIPKEIYDSLITSVNKNLDPLHKYYKVKKEVLGVKELHGYDLDVPLVGTYKMEYTYDEAVAMISKGLAPLGTQYLTDFNKGVQNRWVDVYEDAKKYTGGYNWGPYGVHPYILMNYDNSLDSALTLAHEFGHALNSYYSDQKQPYLYASYPIFTAEVASTGNELLVMDYLINNAKTDEEKLFLLNKQIENIKGTIYTQVMFSEFESKVHAMVEKGEPVSPEVLNNLWLELLKKYNGSAYTVDDYAKYGWSRIPHFYMNFYVYKYATSMSAANELVNNIVTKKPGAVEKYLEFLAAGGSDKPVEILKKAGVDMTSSAPVDNILTYFNKLVDEWEVLLKKQKAVEKKAS